MQATQLNRVFDGQQAAQVVGDQVGGVACQRLVVESLFDSTRLCSQAVAHSIAPHLYQFGEVCPSRVRRCIRSRAT